MGLLTGLFRTMKRKISLTKDNDMGAFRDKIEALVKEKDTLDDGAVAEKVTELIGMTEDLPDGEGKEKLKRYLEDFKSIKGQEAEVAVEAGNAVADLFEKLDKEAMESDLGIEPPAEEGAGAEEKVETEEKETVETGDGMGEEEVKEEEEEKAEEKEKIEDADPDPEYTLEEIYQFIKKRMAEDAEAGTEEEEVETKEEETEEKTDDACGVNDHAMPGIKLGNSSGGAPARGGLNELFKKMKGE